MTAALPENYTSHCPQKLYKVPRLRRYAREPVKSDPPTKWWWLNRYPLDLGVERRRCLTVHRSGLAHFSAANCGFLETRSAKKWARPPDFFPGKQRPAFGNAYRRCQQTSFAAHGTSPRPPGKRLRPDSTTLTNKTLAIGIPRVLVVGIRRVDIRPLHGRSSTL